MKGTIALIVVLASLTVPALAQEGRQFLQPDRRVAKETKESARPVERRRCCCPCCFGPPWIRERLEREKPAFDREDRRYLREQGLATRRKVS
jgi:hypothetical protein